MSKWTPGPWDYACDSYGKVQHSRKACVFQSDGNKLTKVAAQIENWADARLIAAAPEMIEALKAFLDGSTYKSIGGEEPYWHSIRMPSPETMERARLVIAKAEGA